MLYQKYLVGIDSLVGKTLDIYTPRIHCLQGMRT